MCLKKKTRILYFNFFGSHKKMNNAKENLASHEKLQQICNFLVANRWQSYHEGVTNSWIIFEAFCIVDNSAVKFDFSYHLQHKVRQLNYLPITLFCTDWMKKTWKKKTYVQNKAACTRRSLNQFLDLVPIKLLNIGPIHSH